MTLDKCYLELLNCERDYDCLSCKVSRDYWASMVIVETEESMQTGSSIETMHLK